MESVKLPMSRVDVFTDHKDIIITKFEATIFCIASLILGVLIGIIIC